METGVTRALVGLPFGYEALEVLVELVAVNRDLVGHFERGRVQARGCGRDEGEGEFAGSPRWDDAP